MMRHVDLPPPLAPCPECNGPVYIQDWPLAIVCKYCDIRYNQITKEHIAAAWNKEQEAKRLADTLQRSRHDENHTYLARLLGVVHDA